MPLLLATRWLTACSFLFWPVVSYSQPILSEPKPEAQRMSIAINHIDSLLERNNPDAPYSQFLAVLAERLAMDLDLYYYPASRAAKVFYFNQANCLFPGGKQSTADDRLKIETLPMNVAKAYFISNRLYTAAEMLDTEAMPLKVGYRRGNSYGQTIDKIAHHYLYSVNNDSQLIGLLKIGRIDVILTYMPDFLTLLESEQEQPLVFNETSLFYTHEDSLLCHDTPQNREFVEQINQIILDMRASGELKNILGSAYLEP